MSGLSTPRRDNCEVEGCYRERELRMLRCADHRLPVAAAPIPEPVVDEFLAKELVHDQHGPSYWGRLTDEGRAMYVRRFADAHRRAALARREAAGEFD